MASTRSQLLNATCQLLEKQGYYATGLNQIIRESGSPKGSLYYYFPGGKEELTEEALLRVGQEITQRIQSSMRAEMDPAQAVRQFIHQIAHHLQESDYQAGGPITTVALEVAVTNERLRETCQRIYHDWETAFKEGLVGCGIAPTKASQQASMIISAIEGSIILSRTYRSIQPLENAAEWLAHIIESRH